MTMDVLKGSNLDAHSKKKSSFSLILPIKSYEPEKLRPIFVKWKKSHKNYMILIRITPLDSAYQKTLL